MSLHSETLLWFLTKQYLFKILNAVRFVENQQLPICSHWFDHIVDQLSTHYWGQLWISKWIEIRVLSFKCVWCVYLQRSFWNRTNNQVHNYRPHESMVFIFINNESHNISELGSKSCMKSQLSADFCNTDQSTFWFKQFRYCYEYDCKHVFLRF